MNQILYEDMGEKRPTDIKKIILIFCIAILIFGVLLGVIGIVQLVNSSKPVSTNKPIIEVEKYDENSVRISITHDKPISKITYKV